MANDSRFFRPALPNFLRSFLPVRNGMTSYDLFAITVVVMIFGHIGFYFFPFQHEWRVADRFMVPVFLVSVGYNTGRRPSWVLCVGAVVMTALTSYIHHFFVDILGIIVFLRLIIEPFMERMIQDKRTFWSINVILLILYPFTSIFFEYGTLALIMAMAGWINRNRAEVPPEITKPAEYFVFAWLSFLLCTQFNFHFSRPQFIAIIAGSGVTMFYLYNFRRLLLNAVAARPRDPIAKFCSFLGHKSLEIYLFHAIAFQLLALYFLGS